MEGRVDRRADRKHTHLRLDENTDERPVRGMPMNVAKVTNRTYEKASA